MSGFFAYIKSFIWAPTETGEVLPQPSDTPDIIFDMILPLPPPGLILPEPKPVETYEEIITVNFVKPSLSPLDVVIPQEDNMHYSFIVHQ